MSNAAPTKQRTWQYVNNVIVTGGTAQAGGSDDGPEYRKELILHIKDTMIGFATNPWTVAGSSSFNDGVGAMDATDRWVDIDDIRWVDSTGANRSWIVLENTQLGIQFLFDCVTTNNTDGASCDAFVTPTGDPFTGGSINARPTSASEHQIAFNNDTFSSPGGWGSGDDNNASRTYIVHIQHSEDGLATRVITQLGGGGNVIGFWIFDEIVNQVGAMTHSYVARIQGDSANDNVTADFGNFYTNDRVYGRSNAGAQVDYYFGMPSNNDASAALATQIDTQNPYDGRITVCPICVASETVGWQGLFGEIADLFYETGPGFQGRGYPAATRDWMQFGDFVFPWDGSVPITA